MPRLIFPCCASSLSLLESFSKTSGFFSIRFAGELDAQLFTRRAIAIERAGSIIFFFMMVYYSLYLAERN